MKRVKASKDIDIDSIKQQEIQLRTAFGIFYLLPSEWRVKQNNYLESREM
jgi:hypothetical protein